MFGANHFELLRRMNDLLQRCYGGWRMLALRIEFDISSPVFSVVHLGLLVFLQSKLDAQLAEIRDSSWRYVG